MKRQTTTRSRIAARLRLLYLLLLAAALVALAANLALSIWSEEVAHFEHSDF